METIEIRGKEKKPLLPAETREALKRWSIPVVRFMIAGGLGEAIKAAEAIGYPVALKVMSRDIAHKSEAGGVALNLKDRGGLEDAWQRMSLKMVALPGVRVEGYMVEEMVMPGVEVIVGALRDGQFGPVVMFGTGGIFVEIMKDVSFSLAPVTEDEALEMFREVRGFPLLTGFRGAAACDLESLALTVVKLSELIANEPGIREIEINPLIVYEKGVVAVDARAVPV